MGYLVDVIVPTWNNPEYLDGMLRSMSRQGFFVRGDKRLIIVNNGKQPIEEQYKGTKNLVVINCPDNLGWEGGLAKGLEISDAPYVCFQNDDVFIPTSGINFYANLLVPMQNTNVGMVGPTTTVAAGVQSVYHPNSCLSLTSVNWLIFFCVMIRRSHLDEVGGIDDTLPGGDDFDLSMRMTSAGKKIVVSPGCFLIHHAFKTGERVKGGPEVDGGWNSATFTDRVNKALIDKHGFRKFFNTRAHQVIKSAWDTDDSEGKLIAGLIGANEKVLELGCGNKRTVPQSQTVDIRNDVGADIIADVREPLEVDNDYDVVISRHILEHCVDTVRVIENWGDCLKPGGSLIIAAPNHNVVDSIPLDPQHVHAFTPDSLRSLVESRGFHIALNEDPKNGCSFIQEFVKNGQA